MDTPLRITDAASTAPEPARKDPNPYTTPTEAFRKSVARLRKRYGWRQADLAKRAGLSPAVLRNIENGEKSSITMEEMCAISVALGASPAHLIAPGDGADLELAGEKPEIVTPHVVRAWFAGRGWVRPDDLPHMPAALHPDDWKRREGTSLLHAVHLMRELLADIEPAVDPESEATAALDERVMALQRYLEDTARACAQRNSRASARQRIRKAA